MSQKQGRIKEDFIQATEDFGCLGDTIYEKFIWGKIDIRKKLLRGVFEQFPFAHSAALVGTAQRYSTSKYHVGLQARLVITGKK